MSEENESNQADASGESSHFVQEPPPNQFAEMPDQQQMRTLANTKNDQTKEDAYDFYNVFTVTGQHAEYGMVYNTSNGQYSASELHSTNVQDRSFDTLPTQADLQEMYGGSPYSRHPQRLLPVSIGGMSHRITYDWKQRRYVPQPANPGDLQTLQNQQLGYQLDKVGKQLVTGGQLTEAELVTIKTKALPNHLRDQLFRGKGYLDPDNLWQVRDWLYMNSSKRQADLRESQRIQTEIRSTYTQGIGKYGLDEFGRFVDGDGYVLEWKNSRFERMMDEANAPLESTVKYKAGRFKAHGKRNELEIGDTHFKPLTVGASGHRLKDVHGNYIADDVPVKGTGGKGTQYIAVRTDENGKEVRYHTVLREADIPADDIFWLHPEDRPHKWTVGDYFKMSGVTIFRTVVDPVGTITDMSDGTLADKNLDYSATDFALDAAISIGTMGAGSAVGSVGKTAAGQAIKQAGRQAATATKSAGKSAAKAASKAVSKTGRKGKYVAVKGEEAAESVVKTASKPGIANDVQRVRPVDEAGELVTHSRPTYGTSSRVVPSGVASKGAAKVVGRIKPPTPLERGIHGVKGKVYKKAVRKVAQAAGGNVGLTLADPEKQFENLIEDGIEGLFGLLGDEAGEASGYYARANGVFSLSHRGIAYYNSGGERGTFTDALYDKRGGGYEPTPSMSFYDDDIALADDDGDYDDDDDDEVEPTCPQGYEFDYERGSCERSLIFY